MSTWYIIPSDSDVMHYGVKYRSGRRPGFGKASSTSNADNNLRKKIGPDVKTGNNKKIKLTNKQLYNLARKWSNSKNNSINKLLKILYKTDPKEAERLAQAIRSYSKNYLAYTNYNKSNHIYSRRQSRYGSNTAIKDQTKLKQNKRRA